MIYAYDFLDILLILSENSMPLSSAARLMARPGIRVPRAQRNGRIRRLHRHRNRKTHL